MSHYLNIVDSFKKKNLKSTLILLFLLLALPLGLYLANQTQIFKPRADVTGSIIFQGPNVIIANNKKIALTRDIALKLTSPFGLSTPVVSPSPVVSPVASPAGSSTASPTSNVNWMEIIVRNWLAAAVPAGTTDLNGDGKIDLEDAGDLNKDGKVDSRDFGIAYPATRESTFIPQHLQQAKEFLAIMADVDRANAQQTACEGSYQVCQSSDGQKLGTQWCEPGVMTDGVCTRSLVNEKCYKSKIEREENVCNIVDLPASAPPSTNPSPSPSPPSSSNPSNSPTSQPSGSPTAPTASEYKLIETQNGQIVAQTDWLAYDVDPKIVNYGLAALPGLKTITVQYRNGTQQEQETVEITLLEGGLPKVTNISCNYDLETKGILFTARGSNLGDTPGQIYLISTNGGSTIKTPLELVGPWTSTQVKSIIKNPPDQNIEFKVGIDRADGLTLEEAVNCQVGVNSIQFPAKVFCQQQNWPFDQDNAKMSFIDLSEGGTKVSENVTIFRDGIVRNIKTKLQEGREYVLSVKAPKSLRKVSPQFTFWPGTTVMTSLILPVGDIFPIGTPDDVINVHDRARLIREWKAPVLEGGVLVTDFNRDTKVNSIDYACMRYGLDTSRNTSDPEPQPGQGRGQGPNGPSGRVCPQVITQACKGSPITLEVKVCRDFPTPCDVPNDWYVVPLSPRPSIQPSPSPSNSPFSSPSTSPSTSPAASTTP